MKKKISSLVLLLVLTFGLAGCPWWHHHGGHGGHGDHGYHGHYYR